jgi:hypothetical protein
MKRWRWIVLLALNAPLQATLRDPFQALPDPCAVPFHTWRLHATVQGNRGRAVAIVAVPEGWRRLYYGDAPWPGWQVTEIVERRVYLKSQARCPAIVLEREPQGGGHGRKEPDAIRISVGRHGAGGSP